MLHGIRKHILDVFIMAKIFEVTEEVLKLKSKLTIL